MHNHLPAACTHGILTLLPDMLQHSDAGSWVIVDAGIGWPEPKTLTAGQRTVILVTPQPLDVATQRCIVRRGTVTNVPVADGAAALVLAAVPELTPAVVQELVRPLAAGGTLLTYLPPDSVTTGATAANIDNATTTGSSPTTSNSSAIAGDGVADALTSSGGSVTGQRHVFAPDGTWTLLSITKQATTHPGSAGCLICGQRNDSGLGWQFMQAGHTAWAHGTIPSHLQGFTGIAHGGVVAALLDDALWYAANAATGQVTLTAELIVRYRQPVRIGQPVTAAARFLGRQRRVLLGEARLWRPDGNVLATASGRFLAGDRELLLEA